MANVIEKLREQIPSAKAEYKSRRRDLERQIEILDREYGALFGEVAGKKPNGRARSASSRAYGGVKTAVLDAIRSAKGIKPAQIAEKTGLSSPQVHNSLTGLKKDKLVKVKNRLYMVA